MECGTDASNLSMQEAEEEALQVQNYPVLDVWWDLGEEIKQKDIRQCTPTYGELRGPLFSYWSTCRNTCKQLRILKAKGVFAYPAFIVVTHFLFVFFEIQFHVSQADYVTKDDLELVTLLCAPPYLVYLVLEYWA